ncbi:hypothetical protein AVEN_119712-1 [Araneus ventricosus]|uniref:Uncharacterized protein n=1 Tax=Araneus ventricosus TaxID=182803 RepID=A0A4Y2PNM4_ARAVE|nr:hypothetical protein AVEN_119712-1 [Araneus ventricosus]
MLFAARVDIDVYDVLGNIVQIAGKSEFPMLRKKRQYKHRNGDDCVTSIFSDASKIGTVLLPVSDSEWISSDEISQHEICQHPDDAPKGYILEVDMEYPPELHDLLNSYPLAPERMVIEPHMQSLTAMEILTKMNMKPVSKSEKLVPNLCSKRNYVLHYRNLKLYLSLC